MVLIHKEARSSLSPYKGPIFPFGNDTVRRLEKKEAILPCGLVLWHDLPSSAHLRLSLTVFLFPV